MFFSQQRNNVLLCLHTLQFLIHRIIIHWTWRLHRGKVGKGTEVDGVTGLPEWRVPLIIAFFEGAKATKASLVGALDQVVYLWFGWKTRRIHKPRIKAGTGLVVILSYQLCQALELPWLLTPRIAYVCLVYLPDWWVVLLHVVPSCRYVIVIGHFSGVSQYFWWRVLCHCFL